MAIIVSRGTTHTSDGRKVCSRCKLRPPSRGNTYCASCHTAYMREWRRGKVQVLVTPEEWAMILARRGAQQ